MLMCQLQSNCMDRSRSRSSSNTSERNRDNDAEPSKRLFVSNISPETPQADIRELFENVGTVTNSYLKQNESGPSICFIEMGSIEEAINAIKDNNGRKVNGKMMWVKFAKPRIPKEGGKDRQSGKQGGDIRPLRDNGFKNRDGNQNWRFAGNEGNGGNRREDKQPMNRDKFDGNNRNGDERKFNNKRENNTGRNFGERDEGRGNNYNNNRSGNNQERNQERNERRDFNTSKPVQSSEEHDY